MNASVEPSHGPTWQIGHQPLCMETLLQIAQGTKQVALGTGARERMQRAYDTLQRLHQDGAEIYGVTTSVGASVDTEVRAHQANAFSLNLLRMHGCGTGRFLSDEETAAVIAVQLSGVCQGKSGVRPIIADYLIEMLKRRALPVIPAEGSVGASGDLTPMSYVAAALVGEREMRIDGEVMPSKDALCSIGLAPLELEAKEALSLMNGTGVATSLACLGWHRAMRLARLASALSAMVSAATRGNASHFDAYLHNAKPHRGQVEVASWIRSGLGEGAVGAPPQRLQDRYSIRCAPQVLGVLVDYLGWAKAVIETELGGVSDNPVLDLDEARVIHGGNFYGGHIGFVCDGIKLAVAQVACLLDRQLMIVCNPAENGGLPANLVGVKGDAARIHNGFKAVTIATSSLAAEALKLTMPATAFSRSTELHNQDKVPMATIAARDLDRVLTLTEQVAAMTAIAFTQALKLRADSSGIPMTSDKSLLSSNGCAAQVFRAVDNAVPFIEGDRRLDGDIAQVTNMIRNGPLATLSK